LILKQEGLYERTASPIVEGVTHYVMSLIGGAFLIAPMIILTKQRNSLRNSLIVTAVFVLCFPLVLSWLSRMKNQEIVSATAAYAAVLVVLVGLSLPSSN